MTATTTATVETLVAEVRVLMVGSRQITLSVARQLDRVPLSELEVMGRVAMSKDEHTVIGRAKDGSLVVAKFHPNITAEPLIQILAGDLPRRVAVCALLAGYGKAFTGLFNGVSVQFDKACWGYRCHGHSTSGSLDCDGGWLTNGLDEQISELIEAQSKAHRERFARNRAAAGAPLIVLAGLR